MECSFRPSSRVGLYILVIFILMVVCDNQSTLEKMEKNIYQQNIIIDSLKIQIENMASSFNGQDTGLSSRQYEFDSHTRYKTK